MSLALREDVCDWFMAKAETRSLLENVHLVNEKNKAPLISTGVITVLLMWKRLTFDSQKRAEIYDHSWKNGTILKKIATVILNEAA
ncbi:hypothetical protein O5204_09310 [Escherichia coli]|uniref:hypothetical protein n=2 Tax=Escherichia TaxID=561 RepID=UPI001F37DFBA|nr:MULTISPECIES: hypothetical protein [Escherichia]MCU7310434.1 hypothetical protein [Escherichia albertii]MCZ4983077.1 hypothetical protein [Escherichia coli]MCZ4987110.1 hypothetical protein [Escherichia coli]MCZ5113765.1 hypothetical protein [Escherichia coli]MCZ5161761.1 hypothetical protein [Escherichia coli]